ncbi:hypothetical protein BU26DRAFT_77733 [Trematosphaeria pertusa]|uniref:Myb-like domain-containing protein n=1 Tax=Trematosphaeria pertusa TaxID=390896 RepID=A0A6A6I4D1_9PLEO|nr:uncharacterized protein BU26DRAFT_77733 [Trematosphaeria pertusa]KAF2245157.1 hypothetical protein BU26DRAFT_77733 [Trematosphaeria pertusa]
MDINLLIHGSEVQSPNSGPVPQLTTPTTRDPKRLVGINSQAPLPEEPPAKKQFNSSASRKSSASVASVSTGATATYTTAASTYTPSPAYDTISPANIAATPAYGTSSPNHACSAYQSASAASMQGGPVLPAIAEPHRHLRFRPLSGTPVSATIQPGPPGTNGSPPSRMLKRAASQIPLPEESPAKKQSKWGPEEDNLTIELRGQGMKWDDIAKCLPGRSSVSCRLRYQNYLEKRAVWDEEKKDKLARLYARFKDQMWQKVATEMGIPWRSAESMHWQLGEREMSARANALVFQLHPSATSGSTHAGDTIKLEDMPLQKLESPPRQISAKVHPSGVPTVPVPDNWLSIKKEEE